MSRGFTLIEMLVVIGLIALLAALGVLIGYDAVARSTVHSERDLVVMLLTGARARALSNVNELPQGVYIDTNRVVLFERASYGSFTTGDREVERNDRITVSGVQEVIFDQLSANVATGIGSISLTDGTQTAVIDINAAGRIEW